MAIFRLNVEDDNLHNAELVIAKKTDIELESYLESWLENSPWALVEGEPILWIGRQTSANVEESTIFSDLLGQDLRTPDCSCPIHRALVTVSSGDESPNYRALTVQLRKSYS